MFVLLLLGMCSIGLRGIQPDRAGESSRLVPFKWMAVAVGTVVSVAAVEAGLRVLGDRAPSAILEERHDLGEVRTDPRWQYTRRYGRRLRPNVDQMSEWRHGDVVRMGFIPPEVGDGALHRFAFVTDAEGFRNLRTRDRIDIAALGDSFTDAMTLDAADAWPTVLERRAGLAVQNYGTAGFGPQQELRVLTDFAIPHNPRVVVLAYFAGNDIFDAEAFEDYERSNGAIRRPDPGWQIKGIVSRADTWFVVSAMRAAQRWASNHQRAEARTIGAIPERPLASAPPAAPAFDRGMFIGRVGGRLLRWAFMPPYLNTLTMSERDLMSRRGWRLTTTAIAEMRHASVGANADFVLMFVPFKSQVYLPLVQELLSSDEAARALSYYLPDVRIDVGAMSRNRLAQNRMMRRFCSEAGIRFLDTTEALTARVRNGENVYFPDESHLNEVGHAVVAEALRSFLVSSGDAVEARTR